MYVQLLNYCGTNILSPFSIELVTVKPLIVLNLIYIWKAFEAAYMKTL